MVKNTTFAPGISLIDPKPLAGLTREWPDRSDLIHYKESSPSTVDKYNSEGAIRIFPKLGNSAYLRHNVIEMTPILSKNARFRACYLAKDTIIN